MLLWLKRLSIILLTAGAHSAHSGVLDGYLFDTRPLILFSSSGNDRELQEQLRLLSGDSCEFFARDIEVLVITSGEQNNIDGQVLTADEVQYLRTELEVEPYKHLLVLVGKDGKVKLRAHMPLNTSDLFMLVDSMPMRRAERLQSNKSCHSA